MSTPIEHETGRITVVRYFDEDGRDLVWVDNDDLNGGKLGVVEALGLLQLAMWDVCNGPADDEDDE